MTGRAVEALPFLCHSMEDDEAEDWVFLVRGRIGRCGPVEVSRKERVHDEDGETGTGWARPSRQGDRERGVTEMIRNIGVIGAGGVGGYFGGKLCRLLAPDRDLQVFFLARGAHLEEIRRHGLLVSTEAEGEFTCTPTLATENVRDLPVLDLCILSVKSYDLRKVVTELREKVAGHTILIPLLNGVDIYERIRENLDAGIIFPSCVYIGTHIERPGKVTQKGGACTILFGRDPRHPDASPAEVPDLFDRAGINHRWLDDPYPAIWEKFLFIAPFGLVTACFGKTIGEVMASGELSDYVRAVADEVFAIARKRGIMLPEGITADSYRKGHAFPPDTRTSFQRDFSETTKGNERDLFGGTILRMGASLGIETPVTETVCERLGKMKGETF